MKIKYFTLLLGFVLICKSCQICVYPKREEDLTGKWKITNFEHQALTDEQSKLISGSFTFGYEKYEIIDHSGKVVEQGSYQATDKNLQLSAFQNSIISNNQVTTYEIIGEPKYSFILQVQDTNTKLFLTKQQ